MVDCTTVTSADQLEFTWFVMLPVVLLYYSEEGCDFSTGLHLSLVDRVHYQGEDSYFNLVTSQPSCDDLHEVEMQSGSLF